MTRPLDLGLAKQAGPNIFPVFHELTTDVFAAVYYYFVAAREREREAADEEA